MIGAITDPELFDVGRNVEKEAADAMGIDLRKLLNVSGLKNSVDDTRELEWELYGGPQALCIAALS